MGGRGREGGSGRRGGGRRGQRVLSSPSGQEMPQHRDPERTPPSEEDSAEAERLKTEGRTRSPPTLGPGRGAEAGRPHSRAPGGRCHTLAGAPASRAAGGFCEHRHVDVEKSVLAPRGARGAAAVESSVTASQLVRHRPRGPGDPQTRPQTRLCLNTPGGTVPSGHRPGVHTRGRVPQP